MQKLGKVFILSDSYSTFEGYIPEGYDTWYPAGGKPETDVTSVEQTWWHRLISHTESELILNCSYSGTPICNTGYGGGDCRDVSFIGRFDRLADAGYFVENPVDTVFILGGTNDSWADSPIGEVKFGGWAENDLRSVLPAFCYLLSRVKETVPGARVVNILNRENMKPVICDGLCIACEKYGVENADLMGVETMNGHPTVRGMEQIERIVAECVDKSIASDCKIRHNML